MLLCRIARCGLKNAPASVKIWESGDGGFKKSSAAQRYPVKNNRAQLCDCLDNSNLYL